MKNYVKLVARSLNLTRIQALTLLAIAYGARTLRQVTEVTGACVRPALRALLRRGFVRLTDGSFTQGLRLDRVALRAASRRAGLTVQKAA